MTMLYSVLELGRMFWSKPMHSAMAFGARALRIPPLDYSHGSHELAALLDFGARLNKNYTRPEWRHEAWGYPVHIEKVSESAFGSLIRFKTPSAEKRRKLLIVAPMSGHYPTLLRETVCEMGKDHDVFLTEWTNARDVPLAAGDFSLDDYVDFLRQSLREMARLDARPSHAMSVCQPTVPMLAAASLMWEDDEDAKPASLVMIGGPIDARKSPTATNNFAMEHSLAWFKDTLINIVPLPYAGAGRRVYPGFLQHMGFVAMNPARHAKAHRDYFDDLIKDDDASAEKHREFYDEYNAVMDLPESYYLQTVSEVFQKFSLPQGSLSLCGRLIKPSFIKGALMTIEGELDDISGAGQTHSAHGLCSGVDPSKRVELTVAGVGHYGVFSGKSFREKVAPSIGQFIKSQKSKS